MSFSRIAGRVAMVRGSLGRGPRLLVALVGCLGAVAIAFAPAAAARPPVAAPRVSLVVPAEVSSGVGAVATGRVTAFERRGRVQLQSRWSGRWEALAVGALRNRRFRIAFVLEGAEAARVRAVLLAGGRPVASSAVRPILVRDADAVAGGAPSSSAPPSSAAPSTTAPPATEPQAPPPSTSPSEEPPAEEPPLEEPPAEEPPAEEPPVEEPPAPTSAYWGAWIGPQFTGTPAPEDMRAVSEFEALAGKPLSLLETFGQWAACSGSSAGCEPSEPFPRAKLEAMRQYGAIPLYSWASEGNGEPGEQSRFRLAAIADGTFDPYIRRWAEEAKAWGHPFFLRFDWEMNGNWFPWSESLDGNAPGDFVAAWRHVHDIFAEVGASNATWVWCPYVDPNGNLAALAPLYPGDEYVDWTCLDGYNRGTTASPTAQYRSFDYLFGPDYREVTETIAPAKPMLLAEVASSGHGGSKAEWIRDMFADLPSAYPKVRGLLWFDYYDQGNDWPIETSPSATEAFAAGIGDPRYLTNSFAATAGGPVPVP
ncbi:MAG TPA: glycosyl hydrolase [Solirubrobacterales bacterium]|jgi:hypothetical protein|nr:glycosyl hydrolase [Solirubrobacterales bacterium]